MRVIRFISLFTLVFIILVGAAMVFAPIRPFWLDEWFILFNLKTKDAHGLLGELDFTQQFPRAYLVLLKLFTATFNYSYTVLRLPAFSIGLLAILLAWKVMNRIFAPGLFIRYLLVIILVSSYTFTEYFVEIKQYSMDILLSVFAIWQLLELLDIQPGARMGGGRYFVLCAGLLIAPFFSYTYPIAFAPVFVVVLNHSISSMRQQLTGHGKLRYLLAQWFPLILSAIGIVLFYVADVSQVVTDTKMYAFWGFLILKGDNQVLAFLKGVYVLFAQTGAGIIFETLFGILGICGFVYGLISCVRNYVKKEHNLENSLKIYTSLVIMVALVLFALKKLPIGTQRLNSFTTPSIAIMVIYFINLLAVYIKGNFIKIILPAILYLGTIGNIFSTFFIFFTNDKYKKQMDVYRATQSVIELAQGQKIPILVTNGVAYPYYYNAPQGSDLPDPAVWILKVFPAYDFKKAIPVYAIKDFNNADEINTVLPKEYQRCYVGDGTNFKLYIRH